MEPEITTKKQIWDIEYPHMNRILHLVPNPHVLLGKEIVWTEKRDGSNLGIYLKTNDDGSVSCGCRSRNLAVASNDFHLAFAQTEQYSPVVDLLADAENWDDEYLLFGELLLKGKSPTRIETHDKCEFVAFDLWSVKAGGFVSYTKLYQQCHHFDIPVVELWGSCNCTNLDTLLSFKEDMLEIAKQKVREGVVGKHVSGSEFLYFKEKNDTPKLEKIKQVFENGQIVLPPLPESELTGAIEKVYTDVGKSFFDIRVAMPKIAEYVSVECKKHNCSSPEKKLVIAYKERVEELRVGGML